MADRASGTLADKVRHAVRAQRIDPVVEAHEVQRIAREVVRDHEQRSLTGTVVALAEPELEVERLVADVSGLGLLQPFLDDPGVEEVSTKRRASNALSSRGSDAPRRRAPLASRHTH